MARVCSHEVRSLPSVLYPPDVAPYWLALPLRTCLGKPRVPWGIPPGGSPPVFTRGSSAHKLSASPEQPACHRSSARRQNRQRLAFDGGALRPVTSSLRPAARSPGNSSLEVLFPFSAISAVSPFLDAGQPRLLAVYETSAAGLPHPRHFRLQGFSPSWRFSPHSTLPVCFTRQALMGFRACQNTSSHEGRCPKTAPPAVRSSGRERTRG
jgi:hypothetical protein